MNYYNEIKTELIKNEAYKQVKEYCKNRHDLETYYNVGKLLIEAQGGFDRNKYGNKLIKEYSIKLKSELGKGYSWRNLYYMRLFYVKKSEYKILQALPAIFTWSHLIEILPLEKEEIISYYINITNKLNLSYRELHTRIKSKEYERLPEETKQKLKNEEPLEVTDLVSNPIIIKTHNKDLTTFSHKILEELILEDLDAFLKQLGEGFMYVGKEYKLSDLGENKYIDILLYNVIYNCYVPVELKTDKLLHKDIGQLKLYMNYVDKNIKTPTQNKSVGIIISKENDKFVINYLSDESIRYVEYKLV